MRFVDCNGLGGAMALGTVQAGGELVYKCGSLDLGWQVCEANRDLLGWEWDSLKTSDHRDWDAPSDVDYVVGSPPCSGFSPLTANKYRGVDAKINVHINNFVDYVARVRPQVAAFESVQQAYTKGDALMREIHARLLHETGLEYSLTHLLHNGLSVGGPANRRRYFWVASRVPFGIEHPEPTRVPLMRDVIGDLASLPETFEKQPYRSTPTWWSSRRRSPDGLVDGHFTRRTKEWSKLNTLFSSVSGEWESLEDSNSVLNRVWDRDGRLPEHWERTNVKFERGERTMGINRMIRWAEDRPVRVITGSALDEVVHPTEDRFITFREAFRIQGFPDDWRLWPVRNVATLANVPGKGVPVDAARWLAHWVRESLDGRPGSMRGRTLRSGRDGEYELRVDKGHKRSLSRGGRTRAEFWSPSGA